MKKAFRDILGQERQDIVAEIVRHRKSLMQFRFRVQAQMGGESVKPHEVRRIRRDIARMKTALTQKAIHSGGVQS